MEQPHLLMLDDFYALRLRSAGGGEGGVSGEIVMLANGERGQTETALFEVPVTDSEQAAKEWALRALQAYREG
jgi:hypothetical protein